MSKKKRIGIIGTGNISHAHYWAYKRLDNVEVVAACDLDTEKLKSYCDQYEIEHTFTDYKEMLKMEDLDAVSVCTWPSAHAPVALAALRAGKDVLVEKPLSVTNEEAEELQRVAEETGRLLMVGFVMRFENQAKILRDLIAEDRFGELYYSKAIYLRRTGGPLGWYTDKEFSGGGPLLDVGVHVIDALHHLLGQPTVKTISAQTFDKIGPRRNLKSIDRYIASGEGSINNVEDLCIAMIRFDDGGVMDVETSYSHHIEDDVVRLEVYGTKGSFIYDYNPNIKIYTEINNYLADIVIPCAVEDDDESFARQIENFIESIDDQSACVSPGKDGVVITKLLNGIYESAAMQREIVVE